MNIKLFLYILSVFIVTSAIASVEYGNSKNKNRNRKRDPQINTVVCGSISDGKTGEKLAFANVLLTPGNHVVSTDDNGNFKFKYIPRGKYSLKTSYIGYTPVVLPTIDLNGSDSIFILVELSPSTSVLESVVIEASAFTKKAGSTTSMHSLGLDVLKTAAGGRGDISVMVQSLPGVAQSVGLRNDLIVRGGGPSENAFYIDGIKTPNINHFATQGSGGGPLSVLDNNMLRSIDLYTSAMPNFTHNALSSAMLVQLKEANADSMEYFATLGSTDLGFHMNGYLSKRLSIVASVRQSNLRPVFQLLQLPVLATYNDLNIKLKYKLSKRWELYSISVGALDKARINTKLSSTPVNRYLQDVLRDNDQWNYTHGYGVKYTSNILNLGFVASRNMLHNAIDKFPLNDRRQATQTQKLRSNESENHLRSDLSVFIGQATFRTGVNYQYTNFDISNYTQLNTPNGIDTIQYNSAIAYMQLGAYMQLDFTSRDQKLQASAAARVEGSDYTNALFNFSRHFSPRFAVSYTFLPNLKWNASVGRYLQLPANTTLAYSENSVLVNRSNSNYIRSEHFVSGFDFTTNWHSKFTVEGFYKQYSRYPFSVVNSVSLSNVGNSFGIVGNEAIDPKGTGHSYGLEGNFTQLLFAGFTGSVSYTFLRSQFTAGEKLELASSSWDNTHSIQANLSKYLPNQWVVSAKYKHISGNPYTPFNVALSSNRAIYDNNPIGVLDYNQTNSKRLDQVYQIDMRVEKGFNLRDWKVKAFLDLQNVTRNRYTVGKLLLAEVDENGRKVIDEQDPRLYKTNVVNNVIGELIPTIGIQVGF